MSLRRLSGPDTRRRQCVLGAVNKSPIANAGFIAVALLLIIPIAASTVLMMAGAFQAPDISRLQSQLDVQRRSAHAVDALMAHTTLYPDLYGPAGAGPGHLPCPDTDMADNVRQWSRAGPNPPCAARPEVAGAVPAHVTVTSLRAGIDSLALNAAPLDYRLSAEVVNNPVGRVVNARKLWSQGLDTLATVGIDEPDAASEPSRALAIRRASLMPAIERRVALWLVDTVLSAGVDFARDDNWQACVAPQYCRLENLWPTDLIRLEGVPIDQHWFVRNAWSSLVYLQIDPACWQVRDCQWRLDDSARLRIDGLDDGEPVIGLKLMSSI